MYVIDREMTQVKFQELLDECGFDCYGHIEDDDIEEQFCFPKEAEDEDGTWSHTHIFQNETFMLNPYYWGDNEELIQFPNFIYYPTRLEISWYKYPMRAAVSNKEFTKEEFYEMIDACKESIFKFKTKEKLREDAVKREAESEKQWDRIFKQLLMEDNKSFVTLD